MRGLLVAAKAIDGDAIDVLQGDEQAIAAHTRHQREAVQEFRRPVIYCPNASRAFRLITTETRVMLFTRRKTNARRARSMSMVHKTGTPASSQ
jgi:hypothetical protein